MTRAAEYLAERQGEAPEATPPTTTQHPVPGGPARYADVRFETAWKRLVRSMVAYLDATDEADRDRAAFLRSLGWARHLALHLRQYKVNTDPVDAMFSPSRIAASEDVVTSVARHFLAFQEDTQALAEARLLHEEEPDRDLVLLIGSLVALATPGDQPAVAEAVARTFVRAPGDALLATHHDLTAQKVQRKEPGYERLGASMVEVGSWLADPSAATIIGEVRRWRLRYALGSALAGEGTLATRLAHAVPVGPVPGFRGRPSEVRRGARALEAMGLEYSAAASRLRAIAARLETTTEGSK